MIPLLLLFFQAGAIQSQNHQEELVRDQPVTSEISPEETHQYRIALGKDEFAFARLQQQGTDLKITTYAPDGEKLEDFNRSRNGLEPITLTSSTSGDYIIEIELIDEDQSAGKYELTLERLQDRAVTPGQKIDELFISWDSKKSPGAAIAVVKNGEIVFKKGYGMANLEYDVPNGPSTVFHIASVSKQFTVFSVLQLQKEGKLSLDDDIRKYIPEVPEFGKTITLRHLASHTSGLRDQWNLLAMGGWRLDDVITKEHVFKLLEKQEELNFQPGEEYLYCNTGFTLLAEVVARVSGQSFAEYTREHIFEPLDMSSTLFYDDHEKIVRNRAYSYHPDSTGYKKSILSYANVGATSLFTTVEDLSLWAINFSRPIVGDAEMFNSMSTPAVLNNGETFGGALGQFVDDYKGLYEIQHGGADAGYRTYLTRFPNQDFAVVLFSNEASFRAETMAHKVVDIYLEDHFQPEEIQREAQEKNSVAIDQQLIDSYLGEYEIEPGFTLKITQDNGKLMGQASGQPALSLEPISENTFKAEGMEARVEFISGKTETVDRIKVHQEGQIMEGPKMAPFDVNAVDLLQYAGIYHSEELSAEYQFTLEAGKLIATHRRLEDIELSLEKEDVFAGDAWFFGQVEFTRDANNDINGCRVSSGRVRNLQFEKVE